MVNCLCKNSPRFHQIASNKRSKIKIFPGEHVPGIHTISFCSPLSKKLKETLFMHNNLCTHHVNVHLCCQWAKWRKSGRESTLILKNGGDNRRMHEFHGLIDVCDELWYHPEGIVIVFSLHYWVWSKIFTWSALHSPFTVMEVMLCVVVQCLNYNHKLYKTVYVWQLHILVH